jgi:hypothetical protein
MFWFGPITTSVVPFTCISWLHVLQFSRILDLIWSNHHKCCSIYMYFLLKCKARIGQNCNTCKWNNTCGHWTKSKLGQDWNVIHVARKYPFTCIFCSHVLQFSPILVLIWSNHHKCCSIYMYFLATCITVQSYLIFHLVQSPQVLIHLHVFPGYMYYTCGQEIHVNGTTLVVIGPNQS